MSESDAHLSRFLAVLAHELRNPLAPIRNALHLVRLTGPALATDHAEHFAIIDRQVDHLVRPVDDLLDVSRVRQGKIQLQRKRVDLASVVASAVETAQPLIAARRHQLTVEIAGETMTVEGDAVRLVQIVGNIGLPDLDGHQVAARLRGMPKFDDTLLVALTGYGTVDDRRLSREAGFNAHLVKPVDLDALRHILAQPESLHAHQTVSG